MARLRLTVLDDGLFVRTYADEVRPQSATFHRFVEAVARVGPFGQVRYVVPVRKLRIWEVEPALDPVDESVLEVVPTASFSGIADYILRAGWLTSRNWATISSAVAGSDLLWLRLPASNGVLALAAARRHRVPHFAWVAGSVEAVANAQRRAAPTRILASLVGTAYDAVTRLAGRSGPSIELGPGLFTSVVTDAEIEETRSAVREAATGPARVVWAGRMAAEKGLTDLVDAVRLLREGGRDVALVLVGDGPARPAVESALAVLPADRVEDYGFIGDRESYMGLLRTGDLLVHPSRADAVPKVLVEAMAAGLPIVATEAGAVREILGDGERGRLVPAGDKSALAATIGELLDDSTEREALCRRGLEWAADHTAEAEARRLIHLLKAEFPQLDWAG
jgi:glycosyltransferase involved in cell wall biosynthesis